MSKLYDFQVEHLQDYRGIGDAPKDFDSYWKKAIAEIDDLSLAFEIVPSSFQANIALFYDLFFIGAGGARIHCQFAKPKQAKAKMPAVIMFHGYWSNSGDWSSKLGYTAEGYCVLAMDTRGQGGSSSDSGMFSKGNTQSGHIIRGVEDDNQHNLFYRNVYLDTVMCARILMSMEFIDTDNIFATGASQGGALTVALAALCPQIKAIAPIYPFLSDFRGIYKHQFECECYEEIKWYFRVRDPLHLTEEIFFERLGYIDLKNHAKNIKSNTLWITALRDTVCPVFSQLAVYNQITASKRIQYYPEYGHEWLLYSGDIILQYFNEKIKGD